MQRVIWFWHGANWQLRLVLLLSLIGLGATAFNWLFLKSGYFWDLNVYQAAGAVATSGEDAYALGYPRLRFVYSPAVLWLYAQLGVWLKPLFLAAYAAIAAFFLLAAPFSLRVSLLLLFGVMVGNDLVLRSAITGNVTYFLHLLIVGLWLIPPRRGAQIGLLLTITAASLVKPYFAAYFLLWALRDGKISRTSLWPATALALVIAMWLAQAVVAPDSFAAFLAALHDQTGLGQPRPDIGGGFFPVAYFVGHATGPAIAFQILISAALISVWLFWLHGPLAASDNQAAKMLLLTGPLILCLVLNPRFKVYDAAVCYMLCVHAAYLWGQIRPNMSVQPLLGMTIGLLATDHLDIALKTTDMLRAVELTGQLALTLGSFLIAARVIGAGEPGQSSAAGV